MGLEKKNQEREKICLFFYEQSLFSIMILQTCYNFSEDFYSTVDFGLFRGHFAQCVLHDLKYPINRTGFHGFLHVFVPFFCQKGIFLDFSVCYSFERNLPSFFGLLFYPLIFHCKYPPPSLFFASYSQQNIEVDIVNFMSSFVLFFLVFLSEGKLSSRCRYALPSSLFLSISEFGRVA